MHKAGKSGKGFGFDVDNTIGRYDPYGDDHCYQYHKLSYAMINVFNRIVCAFQWNFAPYLPFSYGVSKEFTAVTKFDNCFNSY